MPKLAGTRSLARHSPEVGGQGDMFADQIGFLLVPQFSMMAFTATIEPLRAANRLSGHQLYAWHLFSPDGGPVEASNGIAVMPEGGLEVGIRLQTLIVCAGLDPHQYAERRVSAWLRRHASGGTRIGAVSTGPYLLARAGLLDGYRCTIHWENIPGFREEFPDLEISSELFEIDRNRFTCSGGTAALDMMLTMVAMQHGFDLARAVSESFMHSEIRDAHDPQRMGLRARLGISHPKLLDVLGLMEEHVEDPLAIEDLANRVSLSKRQLERLFRKYLNHSPKAYYLELRLHRARLLLTQTSMSILSVAVACGFVSASHFAKCYRQYYGLRPREDRAARR